jgi:hypothetical protein
MIGQAFGEEGVLMGMPIRTEKGETGEEQGQEHAYNVL